VAQVEGGFFRIRLTMDQLDELLDFIEDKASETKNKKLQEEMYDLCEHLEQFGLRKIVDMEKFRHRVPLLSDRTYAPVSAFRRSLSRCPTTRCFSSSRMGPPIVSTIMTKAKPSSRWRKSLFDPVPERTFRQATPVKHNVRRWTALENDRVESLLASLSGHTLMGQYLTR